MDKIKNYLILAMTIAIMVLLLLKGCNEKCPDQKVVKTIDTLNVYDTIKLHDTLIKFKTVYYPKPVYTEQTKTIDSTACKKTNTYIDSVSSSDAMIYYNAKTVGILKSIDLSAKLLNRKILKETVYITKHDTIMFTSKYSLYGGMNLMGSRTSFDVGPYVTFNFKRNSITASYNVLKQQICLGIGYKLWNSKK